MPIWIIATLVAFFVKGVCGFANTLVFTSIMGFGTNNVNISPVDLLIAFPSNVILVVRNRKKLRPKVFIPLAVLVLIGCIPGAFLLKNADAGFVKIIFGVILILLGIEMFFRDSSVLKFKESKVALAIIGILSGVLCGLFGVGALLAAYVGRVAASGDEFKANISAVFIAENIFRLVLYSFLGIFTPDALRQALILMPFMLIGLFLGILGSRKLNEKTVRKLVVVLLVISGAVLIASQF